MDKVAFIDLEASGLSPVSWPIEVGWCLEAGEPEAHLIQPAPDWPREAWDARAEALHGIPLASLTQSGRPAKEICGRLNEQLGGACVFSDAPDWDGFWLYRLFSTGGVRQRFKLVHFADVFDGIASEKIDALIAAAAETAPHRHRAREDVLHMRRVYELARATAAQRN